MYSSFISGYNNRIISAVGNTLLLLSISGCIASAVNPVSPEPRQQPAVPIPQPTRIMPFLPEPTDDYGRHVSLNSGVSDKDHHRVRNSRSARNGYSVVVHQVPATEVLFGLARDTSLELDIVGEAVSYTHLTLPTKA